MALRYLARRPRSEYEIRQRLRRAGVEPATVDATLSQLRRHRLLDDTGFAEYWVEQRQTHRPRGARLLRAELAQRGVARPVADEAITVVDDTAAEDAYRAASTRAQRLRDLPLEVFEARLGGFLARRGFDWEVTASVVKRLWTEVSADGGGDS